MRQAMSRKKQPPAPPLEERPDWQALATKCRHARVAPTHANLTKMRDVRRATIAGRMDILGLLGRDEEDGAMLYQVAMDYARRRRDWAKLKELPSPDPLNSFWRQVPPGEEEDPPPPSTRDHEEALRSATEALSDAARALKAAGSYEAAWTPRLVFEEYDDATFYRTINGVTIVTTKGVFARDGLRALAVHWGFDVR